MVDKEAPVAIIDSQDIGEAAAKLLALDDPSPHFSKKYNLSGPEDVTGKDIVALLEKVANRKIQVDYRSITLFKALREEAGYPQNVFDSLEYGVRGNLWTPISQLASTPTSPELLKLAPPHSTVEEFIQKHFNQ